MNWKFRILVASALVAATWPAMMIASAASSKADTSTIHVDEISASQRYHVLDAPAYSPVRYRGFADPSFGPNGRPYPVPEYLRGQCYIDLGYGRFASCSNR